MTTKNITFIVIGIIVIVGVVFYSKSSSSKKDVVKDTVNTASLPSQTSAQKETVFNGEGRKLVGPITIKKGLAILKAKNQSGPNNTFSVSVYADTNGNGTLEEGEGYTGSNISVGYENAEVFDGAIAFKSNGGKYFADIDGSRWQITFAPSAKLSEPAPKPVSFSGNGIQVTKKFYLPAGEYSFKATNKGEENFIIKMVDEDGNSTKRLVNEVGNFEGDFTVKNVFDGNYVFTITGGNWTIEKIEKVEKTK